MSSARQLLKSVRRAEREQARCELEYNRIMDRIGGVSHIDGVTVQHDPGSVTEELGLLLAEEAKRIERAWAEAVRQKHIVDEVLKRVDDGRYVDLLKYRYYDDLRWQDIAEKMHYSLPTVYRLHGEALAAVERVINYESI